MSAASKDTIVRYLQQIQWSHRSLDDDRVLTGFRCVVPFYYFSVPIEIGVQRHWVYLRACIQSQVESAHADAVLRMLAALNARCHTARFLLVEGCVILQAEVPAVQCHAGAFLDALKAICRYASMWGLDVAVLSSNASVARLFMAVDGAALVRAAAARAPEASAGVDFDITANRLTV